MAKVMISLPAEFLRRVDREARTQGRSRSELIRESLRKSFEQRGGKSLPWKKALARMTWLADGWTDGWSSTEAIRSDRERGHGRQNRR